MAEGVAEISICGYRTPIPEAVIPEADRTEWSALFVPAGVSGRAEMSGWLDWQMLLRRTKS